jgi:hypothetical protein
MAKINSKEESIVYQVAAKIASELATAVGGSNDEVLANFFNNVDAVYAYIADAHGWEGKPAVSSLYADSALEERAVEQAIARVETAFPNTTVQSEVQSKLRIKGKQHGELPEWLFAEAAKKGVTEVWDNRDGLAQNPKRPHFKDAHGDAAFWPPKGR